jgi:C4-dicarboxylate-specific signal transduction histidine kinase
LAESRTGPLPFRSSSHAAREPEFDDRVFERMAREAASFEDDTETEEARPAREGLPTSYRSRHDAHYVEQLAGRSRPTIPIAVFTDLTEHLGAIGACLHLFGDRERPLRERMAIGLVRTEVQRAAWLSQSLAVLAGEPPMTTGTVDVGALLDRILGALAPERTLTGAAFERAGDRGPHVVRADEQLLGVALAGVVSAVHVLVERVPAATVQVKVSRGPDDVVKVEVSQDVVTLPPASRARFFDIEWPGRPGGVSVGARVAAARRIAEWHGGSVQLAAAERGGCAVTMTIPTAAGR